MVSGSGTLKMAESDVCLWSVPPADQAPEICLAIRLAHYFKVLVTPQKRSLQRALMHPRRTILLELWVRDSEHKSHVFKPQA